MYDFAAVQPTAEDRKWASSLYRGLRFTMSGETAHAKLVAEAVAAVAGKNAWRLDHLLTTEYGYGFGGRVKLDVFDDPHQFYQYGPRRQGDRIDAKGGKGYSSLLVMAGDTGFKEGVDLLLARGASPFTGGRGPWDGYEWLTGTLAREGRTDILLPLLSPQMVPDKADRERILGRVLYATVLEGNLDALKAVAAVYPEVLDARAVIVDKRDYPDTVTTYSALDLITQLQARPEMTQYIFAQREEPEKDKIASGQALGDATAARNEALAIMLVNAGAPLEPGKQGYSPLKAAAGQDLPQLLSLMLDKGAGGETTGFELLRYALTGHTNRSGGTDWAAMAKTVDVILQRLPVTADEIRDAMAKAQDVSRIRDTLETHLRAREAALVNGWIKFGPGLVGTSARDAATGVELRDYYNFTTREHVIVSSNPDTGTDSMLLRESFDAATNRPALEQAAKFLGLRAVPAAPKMA